MTDHASRVYCAICTLAQSNGTPPTHEQIAQHLGVSRQWVSLLFEELVQDGRVEWQTRYTYTVTGAQWIPPQE